MNLEQLTQLISDLKRDEGVRKDVYKCPAGKLTIGVGRNIEDNGLREDEISLMLANDIKAAHKEVSSITDIFDELNKARQNVLVNMCFNMGFPVLLTFKKMFKALHEKNYQEARHQMLDSTWAKQVGIRAERLALQMETGSINRLNK